MPDCYLRGSMASQAVQLRQSSSSRPPLPVINLGRLSKDPATRALVIQDIARACREQGCFQVSVYACLSLHILEHMFTDNHNELLLAAALHHQFKQVLQHTHAMAQPDQLSMAFKVSSYQ